MASHHGAKTIHHDSAMTETLSDINFSWIYWVLMTAYAITIFSIIGVVVSENRNPVKTLAWVTVLLVVPAVGLVLYFLFGRSIKNKRFISRRNRRKLKKHEPAKPFVRSRYHQLTDESAQQIRLGQSLIGAPYYEGNSAQLFNNGSDKFKALFDDIENAKKYVYLQYFIFENDKIGNSLADLLIKKAGQGLDIKIIYDHVGSFKTPHRFFKRMRRAGIEAYPFFKVTFPFFGSRINWRNHRKICLIDGKIGYIGGMNIADRYIDGGNYPTWRDLHIRVTGPILKSLNHSFATDWNFMGRPIPEGTAHDIEHTPASQNIGMQLIVSGPTGRWSNFVLMFLKAISNAKHSIFIQTPYFIPNESLLSALQAAALAKIDVRIMMPRKTDSALLRYASYSYIRECLAAGIKVYLYDKGMLHSKAIVIDDDFSTVGSVNFDFRSFEHNFESNLFIYSKDFNAQMTEQFISDMNDSTRVLPYDWKHRPRMQRAVESFMRLFAPIL